MSVYLNKSIKLDLVALRTGLGWAQSWTKNAILCKVGGGWMRLMVAEPEGFLASWAWPMPEAKQNQFFLIPSFVALTLSGPAAWEASGVEVVLKHNVVGMILRSGTQELRLQWVWQPNDFKSPRDFTLMSQLPDTMISTPYVSLADMVHLSMANLIKVMSEDEEDVIRTQDAILIDFVPGQINIDGESITQSPQQSRYFFNPRMLMRGMEVVRENQISFAIQPTYREKDSILYLTSHRQGWQVHCALLSVNVSGAVTMPSMRIRETRPPMQDGSWFAQRPRT